MWGGGGLQDGGVEKFEVVGGGLADISRKVPMTRYNMCGCNICKSPNVLYVRTLVYKVSLERQQPDYSTL